MMINRRKLLAIEDQTENITVQLNENFASGLDELKKEHSALQQSLGKIEDSILLLQQGQDKTLNLLISFAGDQHADYEKLVGIIERQHDLMHNLIDLIGAQSTSMQVLNETVSAVKTTLEDNWQESATHNAKVLSALQEANRTISEKVTDQGASVIESQRNSTKVLTDSITNVQTLLNQSRQDFVQHGDGFMQALRGVEHTLSNNVTEQTSLINTEIDNIKMKLSDQGSIIQAIDVITRRADSEMSTLDEAMRLLLINTLLNNFPEK